MADFSLFRPFVLGSTVIKNRCVMGAMHTGLEDLPNGLARLTEFYRQRAEAGVGLIFTGGYFPGSTGVCGAQSGFNVEAHSRLTKTIHDAGAKICLQLLHSGRYAADPRAVAPSALRSPISPIRPRALASDEVFKIINDYGAMAAKAAAAGYDGVEINGAEGFLVSQFFAPGTNQRTDQWGGSFENRCRFAMLLTYEVRRQIGATKLLSYRNSLMDLVEAGASWSEHLRLAELLTSAGVNVFNTAVGWNESRVPTTSGTVPRGAFAAVAKRFKEAVRLPVIAGGRINTAEAAESLLLSGSCDLVSMARAFLADPEFVAKASGGRRKSINTCIACNQTCLDRSFARSARESQIVSCLVNPWACHETEMQKKREPASPGAIAIVGAGPAGLAAAVVLAERGCRVTLFESGAEIGGQFRMAKRVPSKTEYSETLRYFSSRIEELNIDLRLRASPTPELLKQYSHVFLATGARPRELTLGPTDERVFSFHQVFEDEKRVGQRVAIIGAGAIAFDVAEFLLGGAAVKQEKSNQQLAISNYFATWKVDLSLSRPGCLLGAGLMTSPARREIFLLQRQPGLVGGRLGRTTGWVKKDFLSSHGVQFLSGVRPLSLNPTGIRIQQGDTVRELAVDSVVVCIGSEPEVALVPELKAAQIAYTVIGVASLSTGTADAEFAIRDGTDAALKFQFAKENPSCQ